MLDLVVLFSLTAPFSLCLLVAILRAMNPEATPPVVAAAAIVVEEELELTPRPLKRHIRLPPAANSGDKPSHRQKVQLPTAMEFADPNQRSNVVEFQAVILAGYGNSLAPLSSYHGDNASPKCLLPIANKPMITFPLNWLEEAGITNVLLICPYSHRSAIAHHIHSDILSSSFSSLTVNIQTYDDADDIMGTCSLLRKFAPRILHDFIILPCDFVPPPNLPLSTVLNRYRVDADEMIISTLFYEVSKDNDNAIVDDALTPPLVAYDATSGTLLHVDYNDISEDEDIELHMRMLWKRSVLSVIHDKPALESIKEDLIPFLCKLQYRKGKRARWEHVLNDTTNRPPTRPSHPPLSRASSSWISSAASRASSAPVSPITTHPPLYPSSGLRCSVEIWPLSQGMAARANSLKVYAELNRLFLLPDAPLPPSPTEPTLEYIDPKAQVSADSIIGVSTRIGERTNIKQSVVGRHCIIGKQVRILGSVILDHTVIEDGMYSAKIEGCIIGRSTRVGAKAELVKSITQHGYEVEAGATLKGEKLETMDWDPNAESDESE
ncbi:hypothetical protein M422DRAFT_44915 [Sphaerobolus stellatus SS14]|nr:hypothetical protein M422DRAFT_44915 [Sphaerobolus stellatus SS14]